MIQAQEKRTLARLSMRRTGSRWCAYITTDSGIDDAVEIGWIPLDAVVADRECRRSFLRLMMSKARQAVEAASGIKVQFRQSDQLTR